jgi:VanZ family protein
MKNRSAMPTAIVWLAVLLAALLWAGLVMFMNRQPPTSANQVLFLLMLGFAVGCSATPICYALDTRQQPRGWGRRRLRRAIRRGALFGLLALALMALRLMRLLTVVPAVLLVLLAITAELAFSLRER